eukprot:gb/GEZN01003229.1/.p1 GENE.gb/GEZN01003229.1/~~gb/GEZN01003229.1/.p1  ORF type:complete len:639 (+),score=81.23 gb/GEZN01003229.1/:58-1974(+)
MMIGDGELGTPLLDADYEPPPHSSEGSYREQEEGIAPGRAPDGKLGRGLYSEVVSNNSSSDNSNSDKAKRRTGEGDDASSTWLPSFEEVFPEGYRMLCSYFLLIIGLPVLTYAVVSCFPAAKESWNQQVLTRPTRALNLSIPLVCVICVFIVALGAYWAAEPELQEQRARLRGNLEFPTPPDWLERTHYFDSYTTVAFIATVYFFRFLIESSQEELYWLLLVVFLLASVLGIYELVCNLGSLCRSAFARCHDVRYSLPCGFGGVSFLNLMAIGLSVLVPVLYLWAGFNMRQAAAWILHDVMGVSVLLLTQRYLRLPNLRIATVLLLGLSLCDLYWVIIRPSFLHNVDHLLMGPVLSTQMIEMGLAMLRIPSYGQHDLLLLVAFGDVAFTGLLSSFLLRFDLARNLPLGQGYFLVSLIGYSVGLVLIYTALLWSGKGQPTLLFLIPCTLGVVMYRAKRRGHLTLMWEEGAIIPVSVNVHRHLPHYHHHQYTAPAFLRRYQTPNNGGANKPCSQPQVPLTTPPNSQPSPRKMESKHKLRPQQQEKTRQEKHRQEKMRQERLRQDKYHRDQKGGTNSRRMSAPVLSFYPSPVTNASTSNVTPVQPHTESTLGLPYFPFGEPLNVSQLDPALRDLLLRESNF